MLLLAVAALAAIACPAHMLWQLRHGRPATCGRQRPEHDLATLRQRQRDLRARIAELDARPAEGDRSDAPVARG